MPNEQVTMTTMFRSATVQAIEYFLPEPKLSNLTLSEEFPGWSVEKIFQKTGIDTRRICRPEETASDLGCKAAQQLLAKKPVSSKNIDYLIFCSQSLDYPLPTTACLIQSRLGLPTHIGAVDLPLGCSGFVYGLGVAKGLIESDQARSVLLITAETYSKYIRKSDRSVRTIFGDAGAAALITAEESGGTPSIGPFVYGTDGRGAPNLIVRPTGSRPPLAPKHATPGENPPSDPKDNGYLHMNGAEIFTFTLETVPKAVKQLLEKSKHRLENIDLFIFHQANEFMLKHLRDKIGLPEEKFFIFLASCGNTVSCSIPIALREAQKKGRLKSGHTVMIVGFGVGYSWAAALVTWQPQ